MSVRAWLYVHSKYRSSNKNTTTDFGHLIAVKLVVIAVNWSGGRQNVVACSQFPADCPASFSYKSVLSPVLLTLRIICHLVVSAAPVSCWLAERSRPVFAPFNSVCLVGFFFLACLFSPLTDWLGDRQPTQIVTSITQHGSELCTSSLEWQYLPLFSIIDMRSNYWVINDWQPLKRGCSSFSISISDQTPWEPDLIDLGFASVVQISAQSLR